MSSRGKQTHQLGIINYLKKLQEQGYRTINLKGKSPDGIAIKDGKIYAVEVLTYSDNDGKYKKVYQKKQDYSMFDDILFKWVKRNPLDVDDRRDNYMFKKLKNEIITENKDKEWDKRGF